MTKEPQILVVSKENQDLKSIFDSERMAQKYKQFDELRQLKELETKYPYITRIELEVRLSQYLNSILEVVKDELSRRDEFNLELIRQIIREEIQVSPANDKEILIQDIDFDEARKLVVNYLKENKIASLSDLSETLKIDLCMLCDIIGELKDDGLIKERE